MKEKIRKISAFLLSAMVLLSTMSFTVDMHYCGDKLVDVAIFKEARNCGMEQMNPTKECGDKMEKKSCCTDKQIMIEGKDDLKDIPVNLTIEQQVFLASFVYSYYNLLQPTDARSNSFEEHPPPLIEKDYQVLYETFLI